VGGYDGCAAKEVQVVVEVGLEVTPHGNYGDQASSSQSDGGHYSNITASFAQHLAEADADKISEAKHPRPAFRREEPRIS